MQSGSSTTVYCGSTRSQCRQWLMPMQLTRKISRCTSMDGSECNSPELEADTLADRQPVQVSGTGTTWGLGYHTGK